MESGLYSRRNSHQTSAFRDVFLRTAHRARRTSAPAHGARLTAHAVMTGFSIPRVAIAATLQQTAGGKREGEIYVMERVPQHAGRETPLDMLNRAEGWFPFRPKGNGVGVLLVAKARTVSLIVPLTQPDDAARLSAAKQARLEVTLADGTQLNGLATLELPARSEEHT